MRWLCAAGWLLAALGWAGVYVAAYVAPVAHWRMFIW